MNQAEKSNPCVLGMWTPIWLGKTQAFVVDNDEELTEGEVFDSELPVNYYVVYASSKAEARLRVQNREADQEWYDDMILWNRLALTPQH